MYVVRRGYEFNESNLYNEVGHWSPDGKWSAVDSGSLEAMEKKAHYLNGGFAKEIEELKQAVLALNKENEAKANCLELLTEHLDGLCKARDEVKEWMEGYDDNFASLQGAVMMLLRKESQEAADGLFKKITGYKE